MTTQEEKIKRLLDIFDPNTLTREEFVKSFTNAISLILKTEQKLIANNAKAITGIKDLFDKLSGKLEVSAKSKLDQELNKFINKIERALRDQEAGMNLLRDKVRGLKDGKDADQEKIVAEVLAQIKLPEQKEIILDDSFEIRNKLETLNGDERLRIEAINGLEEILNELKNKPTGKGGGGFSVMAMDIHIVDDETPSGLINGSNKDFVIAHAPSPSSSLKVYWNGQRLNITEDYTFSGKTISLIVAPDTGNKIKVDYRI